MPFRTKLDNTYVVRCIDNYNVDQPGLCPTLTESPRTNFLATMLSTFVYLCYRSGVSEGRNSDQPAPKRG